MTIVELRILPPLAIGRLGSSPEPLVNYTLEGDPEHPLDFRKIRGLETFVVDPQTGEVSLQTPGSVSFKDANGKIRPVAPFLEVFAVTDQGEGIPAAERGRVFERFTRGGRAVHGGTGLGLAIARWVVELHRGTIAVVDAPGGGCHIHVTLPLRAA